jgi:hypothetical protein
MVTTNFSGIKKRVKGFDTFTRTAEAKIMKNDDKLKSIETHENPKDLFIKQRDIIPK